MACGYSLFPVTFGVEGNKPTRSMKRDANFHTVYPFSPADSALYDEVPFLDDWPAEYLISITRVWVVPCGLGNDGQEMSYLLHEGGDINTTTSSFYAISLLLIVV